MMALSKKQTKPSKENETKPKKTQNKLPPPHPPPTNREIQSSNLKKVLANVEMQDQMQLATVAKKLKRSKILSFNETLLWRKIYLR